MYHFNMKKGTLHSTGEMLFSINAAGSRYLCNRNMNLDPYFMPYPKTNSRRNGDLNIGS